MRRAGIACAFAMVAASSAASAHQGHVVLRAERTLKFEADGLEGLRMVVTVNYGPEQMLRVARSADSDGDGSLSRVEVEDFMLEWAETLRRGLPVRVDGSFTRVTFVEPFLEPTGPIALRPGTLEMTGRIVVGSGRHDVFVTDEMPVNDFERTDVMFTASNEATILASGPTEAPLELMPSFAYGRTTDRPRVHSIGFALEMPPPPEGSLPRPRSIGIARPLALILAQTGIAVVLSRLLYAIKARNRLRRR